MKRRIAAGVICLVLSLAVLDAHVVVTPRESAAGAEQLYTVRVPTEGTVSSMSLELDIPEGLHVMQVTPGDGFTFDVKKDGRPHRLDYLEARDQAERVRAVHIHRAQSAVWIAAVEGAPDVCRRLDDSLDWRARHQTARLRHDDRSQRRSGEGGA